jgi:hypothetical protein
MIRPPTMAPGTEVEAAEDQHRQRLQRDEGQGELHAVARAPDQAGHQGDEPGHRPDDAPDGLQRDADGQRRLVVVGHGAQRPADPGVLEEQGQHRHQHAATPAANEVELGDADPSLSISHSMGSS